MCFVGEIARFQLRNANIQLATKSTVLKKQYETFVANCPVIALSKNINFVWVGMPDVHEGQVEK